MKYKPQKKNTFELLDIIKNVDKAVILQNFKNVGNQSTIQSMLRML